MPRLAAMTGVPVARASRTVRQEGSVPWMGYIGQASADGEVRFFAGEDEAIGGGAGNPAEAQGPSGAFRAVDGAHEKRTRGGGAAQRQRRQQVRVGKVRMNHIRLEAGQKLFQARQIFHRGRPAKMLVENQAVIELQLFAGGASLHAIFRRFAFVVAAQEADIVAQFLLGDGEVGGGLDPLRPTEVADQVNNFHRAVLIIAWGG